VEPFENRQPVRPGDGIADSEHVTRARLFLSIALLLPILPALVSEPAAAEFYRCEGRDGVLRFVDSPELCASAKPVELKDRLVKIPAAFDPEAERLPAAIGHSTSPIALEQILPGALEVGTGWEVVDEAPTDPAKDPDMVEWGVSAQRARHYTRHPGGIVQVCSIEIWAFESDGLARSGEENFAYPELQIVREGRFLVMTRALTIERGTGERRSVFPDCRRLGERARLRAAR